MSTKETGPTEIVTEVSRLELELDAARAASQAKSDFLVNVSHLVRTPLSGVIATASLLLDFDQSPRNRSYIELIESSGRTLTKILDNIFDLARIESGRFELVPTSVDPLNVIGKVVADYHEDAELGGLYIRTEARDLPTPMLIDGDRLLRILSSLVDNAVKFTHSGGIVISCAVSPVSPKTSRLMISVTDTGLGISPERLETIFEASPQLGGKRHSPIGTGLDLAVSKRIIELMGGELIGESEVGVGSTFTISLISPLAIQDERQAPASSSGHREGLRVLLAEDNDVNALIAIEMLQRLTCTVHHVEDGTKAISAAENGDFELILLDIYMPGCSGIEACRTIRTTERHKQTTIGAFTASTGSDEVKNCLHAGMDFVLGKPFNYAQLRNTLVDWFPIDTRG
jgi:CheY-like chemotaxis protein